MDMESPLTHLITRPNNNYALTDRSCTHRQTKCTQDTRNNNILMHSQTDQTTTIPMHAYIRTYVHTCIRQTGRQTDRQTHQLHPQTDQMLIHTKHKGQTTTTVHSLTDHALTDRPNTLTDTPNHNILTHSQTDQATTMHRHTYIRTDIQTDISRLSTSSSLANVYLVYT